MAENQIKRVRTINLANSKIDIAARTVEVAFSSSAEVDRGGFVEILSHERGAMDTHRLEDGAAVLVDHDWTDHVGVVEKIEIDHAGGVGRALLRFGQGARATEIFQDIVDGIRKHISFGYIVHEERKLDGRRGVEVTKFEPYEISIVSVPADVTVGVGRSADEVEEETPQQAEPEPEIEPEPQPEPEQNKEDRQMGDNVKDAVKQERERSAKIRKLGRKFGFDEEAERAVEDGSSVEDFATLIGEKAPLAGATRDNKPTGSQAEQAGITDQDLSQYSIARAIKASASNDWSKAGLERDISNAIADQRGRDAHERGFIVPHEALVSHIVGTREQSVANNPEITPQIYRPDMFIDLLRDNTIVGQLGARMLSGLTGSAGIDIPAQKDDVTAHWIGEGAPSPEEEISFETVSLKPSTITVSVPITRRVRLQSNPFIDSIVQRSIMYAMATGIDKATFYGDGTNKAAEPIGILDADRETESGTNNALGKVATIKSGVADKIHATWPHIINMETALDEKNFMGSFRYCMSKTERGLLKQTLKFDKAGSGGVHDGIIMPTSDSLNGHPAIGHNLFSKPGGELHDFLFGDFSAVMWGFWSSVDFRVDTATKAASDGLVLRAFQDCGMELERNSAFVKLVKGA